MRSPAAFRTFIEQCPEVTDPGLLASILLERLSEEAAEQVREVTQLEGISANADAELLEQVDDLIGYLQRSTRGEGTDDD